MGYSWVIHNPAARGKYRQKGIQRATELRNLARYHSGLFLLYTVLKYPSLDKSMPNNQSHDPRTENPANRVAQAVGLIVAAVANSAFGSAAFGGEILNGEISLTTDGTFSFGAKPDSAKPLVVWLADGGVAPNDTLGRHAGWDEGQVETTVNGEISTDFTEDGQTQSLKLDHSLNETAILNRVYFDSSQAYIFRRRYDDFTMSEAAVFVMRMDTDNALTGTYPPVGTVITGDTSGATGELAGVIDQNGRPDWLVTNITGTFTETGELITWATGTANARNPIISGFNNKTIRLWSEQEAGAPKMNIYHFDGESGAGVGVPKFTVEHSPTNHLVADWDQNFQQSDVAKQWVNEEYLYQDNSAVDEADGIFWWYRNGKKADESLRFVFKTTDSPNPISYVAQAQISGGGTPGSSNRYMDMLYVDTSWCRVVLMESDTLVLDTSATAPTETKLVPCPIKSWASQSIVCSDWREYLPSATHIGVINADNELVASAQIPQGGN